MSDCPVRTMKSQAQPPDDGKLRALLREARPAPALPPRFQESVWRRIERAEAPSQTAWSGDWLDRAAAWLLQPRLALAGLTAMLLAGVLIGLLQGGSLANDLAKQQYLAAVSPPTAR